MPGLWMIPWSGPTEGDPGFRLALDDFLIYTMAQARLRLDQLLAGLGHLKITFSTKLAGSRHVFPFPIGWLALTKL
jgi:hypothetical protein